MSKGLFSFPDFHSGGNETDGEQFGARNDLGQRRIESRSAWPGGLMAEGSGQRRFKNVKRAHEVVRKQFVKGILHGEDVILSEFNSAN
jgi:hypothetical protein